MFHVYTLYGKENDREKWKAGEKGNKIKKNIFMIIKCDSKRTFIIISKLGKGFFSFFFQILTTEIFL